MSKSKQHYWLVVTSPANFKHDREVLKFTTQGLPYRYRKTVQRMKPEDRVIYYLVRSQKFGATATITGEYYHAEDKLWMEDEERWPSRCPSKPDIILDDEELLDAKKLIPDLTFVKNKERWGAHFQGSIKEIPEEDFKLIESEMKKIVADRIGLEEKEEEVIEPKPIMYEKDYTEAIMKLPFQTKSLHDRIGEMLEQIGTWMDYNAQTRHKITPDHAYELDVAWLSGRNPEIAIEVQIGGNLTEAKDRLTHARKFNYRKVIMVMMDKDLNRLNKMMKHEPELRNWMDIWSIGAVYEMYKSGERFFKYYRRLRDSSYREKTDLSLVE